MLWVIIAYICGFISCAVICYYLRPVQQPAPVQPVVINIPKKTEHMVLSKYKTASCTNDGTCGFERTGHISECFFHHGKDRRRDPFTFTYHPTMCMITHGTENTDSCYYCHNGVEIAFHPRVYKTQLCKAGSERNREFCSFYHSIHDQRKKVYDPPKKSVAQELTTWRN